MCQSCISPELYLILLVFPLTSFLVKLKKALQAGCTQIISLLS